MVRKIMWTLVFLVVVAAVLYIVGPRTPVDTTITIDRAAIAADPEGYVAREEANVTGITEGTQKQIIWAFPRSKAKTPLAIVYVHGYSATLQETRPLPDIVARELGANLFFTRLTGHGQNGEALARATVNDWLNDMAEALAVGKAIGEKVVVIATSTGGSLATWAAGQPDLAREMNALVLISPNYRLKAAGSFLLDQPWGQQLADLIVGPERSFEPANAEHAKYWTTRYPTRALMPMAAAVRLADGVFPETVKTPALFLYAPGDPVVDEAVTAQKAAKWGGPHAVVEVADSPNASQHVIAGDILSPERTEGLAEKTVAWIRSLDL
ncbi:alpha/beta hydrolase [Zhengella mangrovi]|uniref:Alpha/beta hydrolase n=1 Tax=Zhengella mangrovi TaxID=1982044 RepID=A0A2G1QRE4_9HYPH|nr:alpha/beta fold hydrolase [Zhengella mangrovi]PHP68024.1 alpha/beta hydrolase [Zhengella mangrovi]